MTDYDKIRNLIMDYELENLPADYTDEELLDDICQVCFARPLRRHVVRDYNWEDIQ